MKETSQQSAISKASPWQTQNHAILSCRWRALQNFRKTYSWAAAGVHYFTEVLGVVTFVMSFILISVLVPTANARGFHRAAAWGGWSILSARCFPQPFFSSSSFSTTMPGTSRPHRSGLLHFCCLWMPPGASSLSQADTGQHAGFCQPRPLPLVCTNGDHCKVQS